MPRTLPSKYSIRGFRRSLASIDSVPQFALLGIASGLVTGLVILAFRSTMEIPLGFILTDNFEDFESLSREFHFLLPVVGAVVLVLALLLFSRDNRRVGVVLVLERLARHQGYLQWKNALAQFVGGVIALGSGQSGGREGPAIHLGAAGSSLLGQALMLPNNSIRVLVGCGAAAAISASFNTPIAGVIFSMEVIVMEYTIAGFVPVILAAVVAALITQVVYGDESAFAIPADLYMHSFYDLPFLVLLGFSMGCLAAAFVKLILLLARRAPEPFWQRIMIAGFVTGSLATVSPAILGVGYDTVNQILNGDVLLLVIAVACGLKIIASATTVAMGIPVGLIGPTLFIGATAGGIIGYFGLEAYPEMASSPGFYAILGMGAMMGAVLQAPLAALMAVMELTQSTTIILPAMLVIVIANLTASQVFKLRSVFLMQMDILGLEYRQNPMSMALNRASVASVMSRSFERVASSITREEAILICRDKPAWLLVDGDKSPAYILRALDLSEFLDKDKREEIDLNAIPATRKDVKAIMLQATLSEAMNSLNESGLQALYVNRISAPMIDSVVGIITREDIESYLA